MKFISVVSKTSKIALVAFILTIFTGISINLSTPASAISDDQKGTISQYCSTIKQSLKSLQKTDARVRQYLSNYYNSIKKNYIDPLSVRLINANQPNANLTEIQSNFNTQKNNFAEQYTDYSRSLEELIAYDCQSDPSGFYNKLTETRKKRETLSATTTRIRNLFSEHTTKVKKLRNSITGDPNA